MNLPRKHLSFSQIDLWINSPESYRKRYYPKEQPLFMSNVYMDFGNEVTEAMERNEKWVAFIPRHKTFEQKLFIDIDGVPVMAFVDNMDLDTVAFNEQKTGMTPWSAGKVQKHLQLDIYSLLLKEKFGKVTDLCNLVWVQTEKHLDPELKNKKGLKNEIPKILLTGEYTVIPRIITQDERDACRELITKVGREIEEDYAAMKHLY